MKIGNSEPYQTSSSSNSDMETEKAPTTFLSLPAELRNEIYKLSGCLEARQWDTVIGREKYQIKCNHPHFECCSYCFVCAKDGSRCWLCLHLSVNNAICNKNISLWVNRNSNCASKGQRSNKTMQKPTRTLITPFPAIVGDSIATSAHAAHIENGIKQPALSKVSKQDREEALSIFYGSHIFLFTLFDRKVDAASIFKWVRTIGTANVALLRKVRIVVRSKADMKYAENELKRPLKKQGLNADGGTEVKVVKLPFPFCYCEGCVRKALKEI